MSYLLWEFWRRWSHWRVRRLRLRLFKAEDAAREFDREMESFLDEQVQRLQSLRNRQ